MTSPFIPSTLLYSGARYTGHQKSKGSCYDVDVHLHSVDVRTHTVCGYLIIKGAPEFDFTILRTFLQDSPTTIRQ
jgi:hypothetical protein